MTTSRVGAMCVPLVAVVCVWRRYFEVFRGNLLYGVVTTFVPPLVYLVSFGFGMSRVLTTVEVAGVTISYKSFVFVGIIGQTLLFQTFFEASYGGFVRMYYQKIYKSISMTPITLREVLWAELLWNASRGCAAAVALILLGAIVDAYSPQTAVLAVPIVLISALLYASIGLVAAAYSHTIEALVYPQLLFVIPMTLFCGVYYPLEVVPLGLRLFLTALPLTNTVDLLRGALLGTGFPLFSALNLLGWTAVLLPWALSTLEKRVRGWVPPSIVNH